MSGACTPGGRAILIGRLVSVPRLRTVGGYRTATLRITTHDGRDVAVRTEEYDLIAFGRLAKSLGNLPAGRLIYAQGRWQARQTGACELVVDHVTQLGPLRSPDQATS